METAVTGNPIQQIQLIQHVQQSDSYHLCAAPGWSQSTDFGHMRGEYYVFPAKVVQKPWPKQRYGQN